MKRYSTTRQKIDKSGKRVYSTTYYPKIQVGDNDQFIYPKFGDRLDNLAHKYYGDVSLWWIIAKANNLDAAHIGLEMDKQVRIPTETSTILDALKDLSY